jgi:hypothetical protein
MYIFSLDIAVFENNMFHEVFTFSGGPPLFLLWASEKALDERL